MEDKDLRTGSPFAQSGNPRRIESHARKLLLQIISSCTDLLAIAQDGSLTDFFL